MRREQLTGWSSCATVSSSDAQIGLPPAYTDSSAVVGAARTSIRAPARSHAWCSGWYKSPGPSMDEAIGSVCAPFALLEEVAQVQMHCILGLCACSSWSKEYCLVHECPSGVRATLCATMSCAGAAKCRRTVAGHRHRAHDHAAQAVYLPQVDVPVGQRAGHCRRSAVERVHTHHVSAGSQRLKPPRRACVLRLSQLPNCGGGCGHAVRCSQTTRDRQACTRPIGCAPLPPFQVRSNRVVEHKHRRRLCSLLRFPCKPFKQKMKLQPLLLLSSRSLLKLEQRQALEARPDPLSLQVITSAPRGSQQGLAPLFERVSCRASFIKARHFNTAQHTCKV